MSVDEGGSLVAMDIFAILGEKNVERTQSVTVKECCGNRNCMKEWGEVLDKQYGLDSQFNKAVEDVKNLNTTPQDEELLEIYGLFKQATVGDVNTAKPGLFDFKGKAKWESWNGRKGTSQSDAKSVYVATVQKLISSYGLKS